MKLENKIIELCEKRNFRTRACRFQVISEMLGVDAETAKAIETITRTIRQIFPKDQVGEKLEQEKKGALGYNTSPEVAIFNQETHKVISNCLFESQEKPKFNFLTGEKI